MQKSSSELLVFSRPRPSKLSEDNPRDSRSGPICSSTSLASKRSCPAGTGVCVVNTTSRETRGTAASNPMPSSSIRWRMASNTAKALCPSLRWRTPGEIPSALRARRPPTPNSNSWRIRIRKSPPYRREVSSRSSGAFPTTSESRRNRLRRPTFTRHTLACKRPLRVSISTTTGLPSVPMATSIGNWLTSVFKYSSRCQPLRSRRCRKYPCP